MYSSCEIPKFLCFSHGSRCLCIISAYHFLLDLVISASSGTEIWKMYSLDDLSLLPTVRYALYAIVMFGLLVLSRLFLDRLQIWLFAGDETSRQARTDAAQDLGQVAVAENGGCTFTSCYRGPFSRHFDEEIIRFQCRLDVFLTWLRKRGCYAGRESPDLAVKTNMILQARNGSRRKLPRTRAYLSRAPWMLFKIDYF